MDQLRHRADKQGDRIAYVFLANGEDEAERITYAELDRKARAIAVYLKQFARPGERVMLLFPNSIDYIAAFFGCIYAGIIGIPTYKPHRNNRFFQRIQPIMADSGATLLLTNKKVIADISDKSDSKTLFQNLYWVSIDTIPDSLAQEWQPPIIQPDDIAYLQYTSGSTSLPKGVMVTHENLMTNNHYCHQRWRRNENSTIVSWLPLFHDFGLIGKVLLNLYAGSQCVLFSPAAFVQKPIRWLQAISRYQAHTSGAPNFAYDLCVDKISLEQRETLDLSSWKAAVNGAEPVHPQTLDRFAQFFHRCGFSKTSFFPTYGLAENTLIASSGNQGKPPRYLTIDIDAVEHKEVVIAEVNSEIGLTRQIVSNGSIAPEQRICIVDPDTKIQCDENKIGEIWISGKSVTKGYWNRPEETAEIFGATLPDYPQERFLRTGDLGFIVDHEIYVTGRVKDVIIIKGRNHFPQDIEYTVEYAHPALDRNNNAAFSIERNGVEQLVVVQALQRTALRHIDASEIFKAIREAVTTNHELEIYDIVLLKPSSVLKTTSGKIQRRACKKAYLEGSLEVIAQLTQPSSVQKSVAEVQDWLIATLVNLYHIKRDEITLDTPFDSYNLDSIKSIEFSGLLAEWIHIELPATLLYDYSTINKLSVHIVELLSQHVLPKSPILSELSISRKKILNAAEPIAIVGMACRLPGAHSLDEYWHLLKNGEDAIGDVPVDRYWDLNALMANEQQKQSIRRGGFLPNIAQFDPQFFGISPREAVCMDPQQRLLLEVSYEAAEDAGLTLASLKRSKTGVFIGISSQEYAEILRQQEVDIYVSTGTAMSIAANRLSYFYDLQGPSIAIDTACSSSLVAVHQACKSLQQGEAELAMVGGVNLILSPNNSLQFTKMNFLSPEGRCKAFDSRADGYVRSEGVGVLILKPLSQAEKDNDKIYAVLLGSAINQDGRTNGLTAPNQFSQQEVLTQAYQNAGISPNLVQYVEAHGTGTPLGDPIEMNALNSVIGSAKSQNHFCRVGSVKANIGHLEPAAGIAGLIKVALMLKNKQIPPQIHFHQPNPHIPFANLSFKIETQLTEWESAQSRYAGVSAFGFGGTNAHIVMGEYAKKPTQAMPKVGGPQLFVLSAKTISALKALVQKYAQHFAKGRDSSLYDICATAAYDRQHFDKRLAIVASSVAELVGHLRQLSQAPIEQFVDHAFIINASMTDSALTVYANQYMAGATLVWSTLFPIKGSRIELPSYPWQYEKYWPKIKCPAIASDQTVTEITYELQILLDLKVIFSELLQLSLEMLDSKVSLLEMGADSIILLSAIEKIERQFQVKIAMHELFEELTTLQTIANYIATHAPQSTKSCARKSVIIREKVNLGFIGRHQIKPSLFNAKKVVIDSDDIASQYKKVDFSLYYFGTYPAEFHAEKYTLIMETTRLADQHQFKAIWLPERHFHELGGFSPNPSVLCAALARETKQIHLRAGSIVLPLHSPIRVAEEWSVVDNLSQGRAGIAFASGWQPDDFAIVPQAFGNHRELMFNQIDTVQKLWRGEAVTTKNGVGQEIQVKIFPQPKQAELPSWITVVNNPETYQKAGELGYGILTNLLGQTLDDLVKNIAIYRQAFTQAGHPAEKAHVAVLLHTFVGNDLRQTIEAARPAFCRYLRSSLSLFKNLTKSQGIEIDVEKLSLDDLEFLLNKVYERYIQNSALIGTPLSVMPVVRALQAAGVDEIGCFIDFGIEADLILKNFSSLCELKKLISPPKIMPISSEQKQLLLFSRIGDSNEGAYVYHIPISLRVQGKMDLSLVKRALKKVIERHSALRMTFTPDFQAQINPIDDSVPVFVTDHSHDAIDEKFITEWMAKEISSLIDLNKGPLIRLHLLKLSNDIWIFLLVAHHIVIDGTSAGIILQEITQFYSAYEKGKTDFSLAPAVQFSQFLENIKMDHWEKIRQENMKYWSDKFLTLPVYLQLPVDFAVPLKRVHRADREMVQLDDNLVNRLKQFSHHHQVTIFMVLFAAYQVFLAKLTGQTEITVLTPVQGRYVPDSKSMVGFCSYVMPIRAIIDEKLSFNEFLSRFKNILLDAYEHQIFSMPALIEKLQIPVNQFPFSSVLFNFDRDLTIESFGSLKVLWSKRPATYIDYQLMFNFYEVDDHFWLECNYSSDLFKKETIHQWLNYYITLLEESTYDANISLFQVSLIKPNDQQRLISWSQAKNYFYERDKSITQLFKQCVKDFPHYPAVMCGNQQITYQALDRRSDEIARFLVVAVKNLEKNPIIVLYADSSIETISAMLGIIKAGAAYLPIMPDSPSTRITQLLKESGTSLILTTKILAEKISDIAIPSVCIEDIKNGDTVSLSNNPSNLLACILYTSGTTGQPKGVMIQQRGITRLVRTNYPIIFAPEHQMIQSANLGFDASLFEIWGALLNGGTLHIVSKNILLDAQLMEKYLFEHKISHLLLTTALLHRYIQFSPHVFQHLKYLIFGGEAAQPILINQLLAYYENKLTFKLINCYGPTENTTFSAYYVVDKPIVGSTVPIGKPWPQSSAFVLDRYFQPTAYGIVGELFVGGDGLASGYYQNMPLTAEKFIDVNIDGEIHHLYKTGDYARWLVNGNLEFLGRIDKQIKIRGHRVECSEVEAKIASYPGVMQAVVTTQQTPAGAQLVGYFVKSANSDVSKIELQRYLKKQLPTYMIPAQLREVSALPLTVNGKINYEALSALKSIEESQASTILSDHPLRKIWCDLLLTQVDEEDDFFAVGGNSLLAIDLINRINQQFNTQFPITWVFQNNTLQKQSQTLSISRDTAEYQPVVTLNNQGKLPPLFLIHPAHAGAEVYQAWRPFIQHSQPCYILQSYNLYHEKLLLTIPEIAQHYVQEILKQQPRGPYYLAGWSYGGMIAYEMAGQLQKLGHTVSKVFLLDSFAFSSEQKELFNQNKILFTQRLEKNEFYLSLPLVQQEHMRRVYETELNAISAYIIPSFKGSVLLFKATKIKEFAHHFSLPDNGWQKYVTHLDVVPIDCDHDQMVKSPAVQQILAIIQQQMAVIPEILRV